MNVVVVVVVVIVVTAVAFTYDEWMLLLLKFMNLQFAPIANCYFGESS